MKTHVSQENLKRITLECGGKSPNIICHDADMDFALQQAVPALFFNSGQVCVSASRLFVHDSIYDEFCEKATQAASNLPCGSQFEEGVFNGPVVSGS